MKTCNNNLAIVTEQESFGQTWSRIRVKIEHSHGIHNNGETKNADLCKKCAIFLLEDAINRIKKGERATAGSQNDRQT